MQRRRRLVGSTAAMVLALTGAVPAWGDADAVGGHEGNPAAAFDSFEVQAQSQAAAGYLFAVGDEENRVAGARTGVAKPPDVYALAAAFQRGLAAGYFYAAVLGRSAAGGAGVAPEPPPGETRGLYPSEPRESTWEGPVTAGVEGPVVDGRSEARATATPTGRAVLELQRVTVPDQLDIEGGWIESRGAPVAAGVEGESVSVLSGLTVGSVLRIETLTSRAYGLVPAAAGDPQGVASTVVEGASVNGTPVRITHGGIEVGDQTPAGSQKAELMDQIRRVLAGQGIEDVRLGEASAEPQTDGVSVRAGVLRVIYRNATFGASNPQGFAGGGFELGGATVSVTARRAAPDGPARPELPPAAAAPPPPASGSVATDAADPGRPASGGAPPSPGPPPTAALPPSPSPAVSRAAVPGLATATSAATPTPDQVVTTLRPAANAAPVGAGPDTARWTGVAFLLLGSIPLGIVLVFRLARPMTSPPSCWKGS